MPVFLSMTEEFKLDHARFHLHPRRVSQKEETLSMKPHVSTLSAGHKFGLLHGTCAFKTQSIGQAECFSVVCNP